MKNYFFIIILALLSPSLAWSQSDQGANQRLEALARKYLKTNVDVLTGSTIDQALDASADREALERGSQRSLDRKSQLVQKMKSEGLTYTKGRLVEVDVLSLNAGDATATATASATFEYSIKAGPGAPDKTVYTDVYSMNFVKEGNKWMLSEANILPPTEVAGPALPDSVPASFLESLPKVDASVPTLKEGSNPNPPNRRRDRTEEGNGGGGKGPDGADYWRAEAPINYQAAVDYAVRWARSTNPNYRRYGNDCTNFISQCMKAGGWTETGSLISRTSNSVWFYGSYESTTSYTWAGAHNYYLFNSQSDRAFNMSYFSDLLTGDVLSIDFGRDGHIGHTVIVTAKTGSSTSQIYISYHTSDTLNRPLSDFMNAAGTAAYYAWGIYY